MVAEQLGKRRIENVFHILSCNLVLYNKSWVPIVVVALGGYVLFVTSGYILINY